jgi:transcriptional regulator with XRE-family HTH domain
MHGRILRQLPEAKGRSHVDVARSAGISLVQLARPEANQRGLCVENFVNIAAGLGERPRDLLPNDLGDVALRKPRIDRLVTISAGVLLHATGKRTPAAAGFETRESTRGRSITI